MRVLGVDPGLARTGVAVVEGRPGALRLIHAECVETVPTQVDAVRLAALFATVERVIAAHRPQCAAVEELFFATNRRSAMRVSQARGVVLCAIARAGLDVSEYTPMQVKEAVAGWGGAKKQQVGRMTRALLGADDIPGHDAADACAVAVCHHHRARMAAVGGRALIGTSTASPRLAEAVAKAVRAS